LKICITSGATQTLLCESSLFVRKNSVAATLIADSFQLKRAHSSLVDLGAPQARADGEHERLELLALARRELVSRRAHELEDVEARLVSRHRPPLELDAAKG
jgi:hypothetical protein